MVPCTDDIYTVHKPALRRRDRVPIDNFVYDGNGSVPHFTGSYDLVEVLKTFQTDRG